MKLPLFVTIVKQIGNSEIRDDYKFVLILLVHVRQNVGRGGNYNLFKRVN